MSCKKRERACDQCRKKKTKCIISSRDDADQAIVCDSCKNLGTLCTFAEPAKRRGPPKGYVEHLEQRIGSLERLLRAVAQNGEQLPEDVSESLIAGNSSQISSVDNAHEASLAFSKPRDTDRILSSNDEIYFSNTARCYGNSSAISIQQTLNMYADHLANATDHHHEEVLNPVSIEPKGPSRFSSYLMRKSTKNIQHFPLPPSDLIENLVAAFFNRYTTCSTLLLHTTFISAVESQLYEHDTSFRALLFAVMAVASRFSDDPRTLHTFDSLKGLPRNTNSGSPADPVAEADMPLSSRGYAFTWAAMSLSGSALEPCNLYDLQSSVLIIDWLCVAGGHVEAWPSLGLYVRQAQDMGAHRRGPLSWASSPTDDQLRKRAWWHLYTYDRLLSAALGRPMAISDDDVDVNTPLEVSDDHLLQLNANETSGPTRPSDGSATPIISFNCLISLVRIIGRTLNVVNSPKSQTVKPNFPQRMQIAELDAALNNWITRLPAHLRWKPDEADDDTLARCGMLLLPYFLGHILIHRNFLDPMEFRNSELPSGQICARAARSMSQVLNVLGNRNVLQSIAPFVNTWTSTAGLTLCINLQCDLLSGGYQREALNEDINKCSSILERFATRIFGASEAAEALSYCHATASRQHPSSALKLTGTKNSRSTTSIQPEKRGSQSESRRPSVGSQGADDYSEGPAAKQIRLEAPKSTKLPAQYQVPQRQARTQSMIVPPSATPIDWSSISAHGRAGSWSNLSMPEAIESSAHNQPTSLHYMPAAPPSTISSDSPMPTPVPMPMAQSLSNSFSDSYISPFTHAQPESIVQYGTWAQAAFQPPAAHNVPPSHGLTPSGMEGDLYSTVDYGSTSQPWGHPNFPGHDEPSSQATQYHGAPTPWYPS